ncbi:MAG: adenylate/guanylate cyclase domain-containing protein [Helicobacteraceae bacterium]|nr:adenylate/guanylate cyclase domain-containing protein [Helicobacteraceae bacterium]
MIFSLLFFAVILVFGTTTFYFTMRQMVHVSAFERLTRAIETRTLQFSRSFEGQIRLALNMADSPIIENYMKNPQDKSVAKLALTELESDRRHFASGNIFWISNTDHRYYFNAEHLYTLDPAKKEHDWYLPSLRMESEYAFNVNYDVGLKKTMCWINVPVKKGKEAVGLIGTGLDLTAWIESIFANLDDDISLYIFNSVGEITGASNAALMERKAKVGEILGEAWGPTLMKAEALKDDASETYLIGENAYAIGKIKLLDWYIVAYKPLGFKAFSNNVTLVFAILILLVCLIFLVFNLYIASILRPINLMFERMRDISKEWKKNSRKLHYRKILLISLIFVLIIALNFAIATVLMRRHLSYEAEIILNNVKNSIEANLHEGKTALLKTGLAIEEFLRYKLRNEVIADYLTQTTELFIEQSDTIYGFIGLYADVNGVFYNGSGWEPPEGWQAKDRPWYKDALSAEGKLVESKPYLDSHTGESVVTYSKTLSHNGKELDGVIGIDILLSKVAEYTNSIILIPNGYGVLLDQNLTILAHPDKAFLGLNVGAINEDWARVEQILLDGGDVTNQVFSNYKDEAHIIFSRKLNNGWVIAALAPYHSFFSEIAVFGTFIVITGVVLLFVLLAILERQHRRIENYTDVAVQLNESSRKFLPDQFLGLLGVNSIKDLRLGACVRTNITVMFFDIRFFSIHSQILSLQENFDLMNRIFKLAGDAIKKNNGFVDKYLGDSAMILFVEPEDSLKAGIEIYHGIIDEFGVTNGINIGVGAHSGSVMMGIIGDDDHYSGTVISKHVNTASRIESLTKQVGAAMLISAEMAQEIVDREKNYKLRYLGIVKFYGFSETMGIFEVLDALNPDVLEIRLSTLGIFHSAVRNYLFGNYKQASKEFKQVIDADPTDLCAKRYYGQALAAIHSPKELNVFVFDEK